MVGKYNMCTFYISVYLGVCIYVWAYQRYHNAILQGTVLYMKNLSAARATVHHQTNILHPSSPQINTRKTRYVMWKDSGLTSSTLFTHFSKMLSHDTNLLKQDTVRQSFLSPHSHTHVWKMIMLQTSASVPYCKAKANACNYHVANEVFSGIIKSERLFKPLHSNTD